MKRFLTIMLATLALTAALCVNASASSFDSAAEELAAIGMFKGTASGFALDQAPTRGQAAIMLVRLYGKETEAQNTYKSGRVTCPFTDVNETVAPYVAWLVDEGLANGTSDTTFGASEPCTARAYTIFLLRALGYEDGTDFVPATAQMFAKELGMMDTSELTGTFLRDDLTALTYQALGLDLKDGSTYLLDSLIKEDRIDYNAAYPIVEKIENYRAVNEASAGMSKGFSTNLDMSMALTATTEGSSKIEQSAIEGKGQIQMIMGKDPQMAVNFDMTMDGEKVNTKAWMVDGWVYSQSGEESVKAKLPDDVMKNYQELMTLGTANNSGVSILPFLESITKNTSGSDTVYTLDPNDAFIKMLNGLIGQAIEMEGEGAEIALERCTITYTVRNKTLKTASADLAMSMNVTVDVGGGQKVTTSIGASMQMEMDITSSGSAVKIKYPDFSDFKEIIGGANGPTGIYA